MIVEHWRCPVLDIPLDCIVIANNDRKTYSDIDELAKSIDENGLLQPIVVRPILVDLYELVAGHRRYFAHKHLGRKSIPAVVRELDDESASQSMWLENGCRVNLNPIEEARAFMKRKDQFRYSDEDLARNVSRSVEFVKNRLSLLSLTDEIQHLVGTGQLKLGYAFAMVGLDTNRQAIAVSALSRMKSLTEYRRLCGELMAEQVQESLFDMTSFMTQATEIRDDRKARKQNIGLRVASDLPAMDNAVGVGRVLDKYVRKLRAAGLDRDAEVVAFVYLELIRLNKAKPLDSADFTQENGENGLRGESVDPHLL